MLLTTIFIISTYSTEEITGVICNSATRVNLAYVNIGIDGKSVGTVSNKDGYFSLKLNDDVSAIDSITFSHIGYETKKISIKDFTKDTHNIELSPSSYEVEEVVVQGGKIKQKQIQNVCPGLYA